MPKLSVIIITLNEESRILRTLESVKPVADEIVVVDSMSTDQTVSVCRDFGCRVFLREFDGYGTQKQFAVEQVSNDWVMYLDADEVVTTELREELRSIFSSAGASPENLAMVRNPGPDISRVSGFLVRSSLSYMGRILRHGGVGKEYHLRLFDRKKGGFTTVPVHEGIEVTGETGMLKGRVIHYSYRGISHHLEKINNYTSLAADGYVKQGKSFSKIWVAVKFPVSFFSFYIIKGGFLDGYPGFMWSFLAAVYGILKVAKTVERSQNTL